MSLHMNPTKGSRVLRGGGLSVMPGAISPAQTLKARLAVKQRSGFDGIALYCRFSWGPLDQGKVYTGCAWRHVMKKWHHPVPCYMVVIGETVVYAPTHMFEVCNTKRTVRFPSKEDVERFMRQAGKAKRHDLVLPC